MPKIAPGPPAGIIDSTFLFLFMSDAVVANSGTVSLLQHLSGWKEKETD